MKKIVLLIIAAALVCQAFEVQSEEVASSRENKATVKDSTDRMFVIVGQDAIRIEDQDSSLVVKVGDRGLKLLESLEGNRRIEFTDDRQQSELRSSYSRERNHDFYSERYYEDDRRYSSGARSFRGHLSGLEVGFNNFNHLNSMSLPPDISYMELDASKSVNFNLILGQTNIGFGRHIGIVAGLGLNWNNYRFDNGNSITEGSMGFITELIPDNTVPVKRSKFSALYLNVPVLLEYQIPAGHSYLNIGAGVVGGMKLNAWTKVVFENGEKTKVNGDYNLNLLRGGLTGRIGYRNIMIYGTYYLTPWFQDLKGPEGYNLEPFEIGVAFTFND